MTIPRKKKAASKTQMENLNRDLLQRCYNAEIHGLVCQEYFGKIPKMLQELVSYGLEQLPTGATLDAVTLAIRQAVTAFKMSAPSLYATPEDQYNASMEC